ncbi:unnamed protein product [Discosporangium mesarthrocarpum]
MEINPITMDGEQEKQMMVMEVIPAIKARMPGASARPIWVQQDGSKAHARSGVVAAIEAADRGNIILETQPPSSPDLNVLELGFFHSIQRLKDDLGVSNVRELVKATIKALDEYPRETLERCWHCLFALYGEVLGCKGDNNFRIPHPGINKAQRAGKLSQNAWVDEEKYRIRKGFLMASI